MTRNPGAIRTKTLIWTTNVELKRGLRDGCSADAAPTQIFYSEIIPCKDVSPEGDEFDMWPAFQGFLDKWEEANEAAPLETQKQTERDIKYLRKYGCDYLKNSSLWDSMDSYEAWRADTRNNLTARPPYYLGRNLCVRGRGHKPLSLWCPEACGCHRGDQDCPLECPERDATTRICPAHQKSFWGPDSEASCPRHPRAYIFDVGFSSVGTSGTARRAAGE